MPLVDVLAALAGVAGAALGVVALVRSRGTGAGTGRAITGTALSVLGVLVAAVVTVLGGLLVASAAATSVENASVQDEDGQASGPMTDDVRIDECYDLRDGVQAVGVTVTDSTALTRRYVVTVTARDQAGRVVGTARARSHDVAPGASELIADTALVTAPVAACVVSQVTRT